MHGYIIRVFHTRWSNPEPKRTHRERERGREREREKKHSKARAIATLRRFPDRHTQVLRWSAGSSSCVPGQGERERETERVKEKTGFLTTPFVW